MALANGMLQVALWYADLGYPVFPCAPGCKKPPLTPHGLLDATTDSGQIERWWTEHPRANIAIRTDGLIVIDVDGADNPWLTDEPERLQELATAPTALTPRGGRQHVFRQPANRAWRNTTSQLAHQVDTRADGGYIVVAPSVVEGKLYRWLDDQTLDIPREKLPEPPGWLSAQLDELPSGTSASLASDGTPANAIPEGQRNATLARLAGAMRRVGMTRDEILAALNRVNVNRCRPPLDGREVVRTANSIARYEPDAVSVALVEDHFGQDFRAPSKAEPLSAQDLLRAHPTLRAPVIMGLLRQGETMNIIAPPKTGKSWLVFSLAMAVAAGRRWLRAFDTVAGNVLVIDNELHAETLAHRIPQVAAALGIGMDEIASTLRVQSLRGQLRDIFSMRSYFDALQPGRFKLIVLDAFYRFMPVGNDENDNATMANIYNRVDAFADRLGCCFVLIHHTSKGSQSTKSVTDVGAGAGSQSRATDTHLVMRPHEESRAVVLDAAVRSWPPIEPMALRWEFPIWTPAPDLDPTQLKSDKPRRTKASAKPPEAPRAMPWTVERFVEVFLSGQPTTKAEIRERATAEPGLSWRRVSDFLEIGERQALIERVKLPGQGGPLAYVRRQREGSR
jgi:hypothetical protein